MQVRLGLVAAVWLGVLAGCATPVETGEVGGGRAHTEISIDGEGGGGVGGSGGSSACDPSTVTCEPPDFQCGPTPDDRAWTCYTDPTNCTCNCSCITPVVLSFDDRPVVFLAGSSHAFALSAGASLVTDWPTAATPWLALDRDGNGRIDDGSELFGSMTRLATGLHASNGFEALRDLDDDGDGRIDARDPAFARLLIWRDRNGDRISTPDELEPASGSLVSIDLGFRVVPRCDERGNCEVERSTFRWRDASGTEHRGAAVDVHLRSQP